MANSEHIEWLLQGVKSWNELRERTGFKPDFRGVDLYDAFDKANRLDSKGRIPLHGVNLTDANLEGANLSNASLWDANLTRAHLKFATLINADLWQANLAGANLFAAHLHKANLRDANLNKTELQHAHLIGPDLSHAEPWRAVLYRAEDIGPEQLSDERESITIVENLLSEIRNLRNQNRTSLLYFRGEHKCGWTLRPSVMRDDFMAHENDMLVDLMSRRPGEFSNVLSALGQWVLAQHHGLRTRFLDITRNPLVALYHACEQHQKDEDSRFHIFAVPKQLIKTFNSDVIRIIGNFAKLSRHQQEALLGKRDCSCHMPRYRFHPSDHATAMQKLYQLIRLEKPTFDERINPRDLYKVFIVEPPQFSDRIRAQSGAFLVSAFHDQFERNEILRWNDRTPVYAHYQLTIPSKSKSDIIKDLRFLNITRETLFPGLDTSAKAITDLYLE